MHPQPPFLLHQLATEQNRLALFSQSNVSLPHEHPTKSFWTHGSPDANPLAKEGSKGTLTTDADIVIIGSGITGVGAAYHLSQVVEETGLSLKILILEARDFCSGATGRNGGHLTPNAFQGFRSIAAAYGADEALRWISLENHTADSILSILKSTKHEDQVDLVGGRHLRLYFTEREECESKTDWTAAKAAGVNLDDTQFLSAEHTHQMYGPAFPAVSWPGHNLWPLKVVTHFFKIAQEVIAKSNEGSTLNIHTQTPVTSIQRLETQSFTKSNISSRRWRLDTPRGSVRAHTVIHATNAYAAHLLPFLAASPGRESIVPTRGQVLATRSSVGSDVLRKASFTANDGFEYWFPRPVNKSSVKEKPLVILGGGREIGGPNYEHGITDDSVVNPDVSRTLRNFLPEIYPEGWFEKGKEPDMEWTGIMGYTQSTDPLVGPVVDSEKDLILEGQYIAAGYSGHGMPRAFGCAEALIQIIISDLKNQTWEVPSWFPNHFLTTSKQRLSQCPG